MVKSVASEAFEALEEVRPVKERQVRGRHVEGHVIPEILHLATEAELRRAATNAKTAEVMHRKTMERIQAHKLGMRLIQSHYSLDCRLLLCQFTADGRVDFRELLQDLSSLFRTRIELRQVGVRDEAAIIGGVGACGRPYCCATFLHNIASVNVRMAKQQGISLTPQNISGACGRLKCCLHFEQPMQGEECPRNSNASERRGEAGTTVSDGTATTRCEGGGGARRRHGEEEQRGGHRNSGNGGAPRRETDCGNRSGGHRRPSVPQQPQTAASVPQAEAPCRTIPDEAAKPSASPKCILPLRATGIVPLRPPTAGKKNTDE